MPRKESGRREFLKNAVLASAGAAAVTLEEQILLAKTSAKPEMPVPGTKGLPTGRIGSLEITRLICGGNLFSGYAHSRNLVYVSSLMRHYFTDEKIIETFEICEQSGINAVITTISKLTTRVLSKHRKNGGKLQWVAQMHSKLSDPLAEAKAAVDNGAVAAFVQGAYADRLLRSARGLEAVKKIVSFLKGRKLVAGVGGHSIDSPMTCEKEGVDPDFYFKTLNAVKYHSATPQKTIEFMKTVKKPWIAYKVLGAGVVDPAQGFKYALQNGADFMCVGMFDFQVTDDVQILKGIFARGIKRQRPWDGAAPRRTA